MNNSPPIVEYSASVPTPHAPSPALVWVKWLIGMACMMLILPIVVHFHMENQHFDAFFPNTRQPPFPWGPGPRNGAALSFQHDLVTDEWSWRLWWCVIHQDASIIPPERPVKPSLVPAMRERIADNGRWNRFVDFVHRYTLVVAMLSPILLVLSVWLLWALSPRRHRWRYSAAALGLITSVAALWTLLAYRPPLWAGP